MAVMFAGGENVIYCTNQAHYRGNSSWGRKPLVRGKFIEAINANIALLYGRNTTDVTENTPWRAAQLSCYTVAVFIMLIITFNNALAKTVIGLECV